VGNIQKSIPASFGRRTPPMVRKIAVRRSAQVRGLTSRSAQVRGLTSRLAEVRGLTNRSAHVRGLTSRSAQVRVNEQVG